jgi:predicted dehydrogenase
LVKNPIRAAIVGGHRGGGYRRGLAVLPEKVVLSAVCDRDEAVLDGWRREFPGIPTFRRYEDLLAADACDAVLLATPIQMHAAQSVGALGAGKHVLCEVVAGMTLDELWALIEAVEQSGRVYMMAENYCYTRPNMMVRHLVDGGMFGERTYAEGA